MPEQVRGQVVAAAGCNCLVGRHNCLRHALRTPQAVTDAAQRCRDALISRGQPEPITFLLAALKWEWRRHVGASLCPCDEEDPAQREQAEEIIRSVRGCRPHLYVLAMGLAQSPYHDREAHAAFRLLMDKMAETKDDQQIAWCARTWLRHAIGRVSVKPREEDDISDLLLADEAPHRDVLLKDVAFMDLLVSEWLLKRRLDLATAWRCETLKLLTKVAQSPLLDWPLLLAALAVMAVSVWRWQPLSLVMAIAWCLLVVIAPHFGRALTPRLLASVLIGWLALSTSGWAWEFASQREHATMCIVADVVVSILCFFYVLFGEIRRHVGWLDFRRGARIWLVGALHALATGLVGFAVVGGVVDAVRGAHWYAPLPSSSLTILKLSPFALTIGLLTQTLWEREAVTEPL